MPDNQFSVAVPNPLQALLVGEQGYKDMRSNVQESQKEQARQAAAKAFSSNDPGANRNALAALLAAGDVQGANAVANFGQQDWERGFRTTEAGRAQTNADRSFGLQQQTANTAQIVTAEDANGNKTPIRVDREGRATAIQVPGVTGGAASNPYAYGKQNENQSKDSGYANRMFRAEGVLRDPKVEGAAVDMWQNTLGKLPGVAANYATSPDYQKFDQAKRDFVNAVLRRESGAAISQSEFDNATKQYFPQPGDSKERIAEKRRNRQDAIAGVAGGGGQNYRPPFTFDQAGGMVPTGNPGQGSASVPQAAAASQAPNAQNQPVKVGSAQERDALPPGTPYIAPDGSLRTKQ